MLALAILLTLPVVDATAMAPDVPYDVVIPAAVGDVPMRADTLGEGALDLLEASFGNEISETIEVSFTVRDLSQVSEIDVLGPASYIAYNVQFELNDNLFSAGTFYSEGAWQKTFVFNQGEPDELILDLNVDDDANRLSFRFPRSFVGAVSNATVDLAIDAIAYGVAPHQVQDRAFFRLPAPDLPHSTPYRLDQGGASPSPSTPIAPAPGSEPAPRDSPGPMWPGLVMILLALAIAVRKFR